MKNNNELDNVLHVLKAHFDLFNGAYGNQSPLHELYDQTKEAIASVEKLNRILTVTTKRTNDG